MNTDKILTGWNTWDTYSATTYVHMPEGYGVRIGLKEYLRGTVSAVSQYRKTRGNR